MKKNVRTSFSKKELTIIKENYGLPYDFYGYLLNNKTESSVKSEYYRLDRNDVIRQRNLVLQKLKKDPRIVNLKNESLIKLINNAGLMMDDSTLYKNDKRNNYSIKSLNILIYSINKFLNDELYASESDFNDFITVISDLSSSEMSLSEIERENGLAENVLNDIITKKVRLLKTDAIKISSWFAKNLKKVQNDLFTYEVENEVLNDLEYFNEKFKSLVNKITELKQTNIRYESIVSKHVKEISNLKSIVNELDEQNENLNKVIDSLEKELTLEKEKNTNNILGLYNSEELVAEVETSESKGGLFSRFINRK